MNGSSTQTAQPCCLQFQIELWWPSEQLQQDTLDAHGIITEMLTSIEAGLDAYAIEVGETAYWKLPPLEIGVNGDWTSGWSKTSGQLS